MKFQLRQEMKAIESQLRQDMKTLGTQLRQEIRASENGIREEIRTFRHSHRSRGVRRKRKCGYKDLTMSNGLQVGQLLTRFLLSRARLAL